MISATGLFLLLAYIWLISVIDIVLSLWEQALLTLGSHRKISFFP